MTSDIGLTLGRNAELMNLIRRLYSNASNIARLNQVKTRLRDAYNNKGYGQFAQYDDVESEIICLLLMHINPKSVYEFSPCGGWSTLYILNTLNVIGGDDCKTHSFDIADLAGNNLKMFPSIIKNWTFHLGDVQDQYHTFTSDIDYLFIDSDHSSQFTARYVTEVLTPLLPENRTKNENKKIFVSVHDVFHTTTPSEEGSIVIDFLKKHGISYFSPRNSHHLSEISELRRQNKVNTETIHYYNADTSIFFVL